MKIFGMWTKPLIQNICAHRITSSDVTDIRIHGCPHQNLTSASATKRVRMPVKLKKNEIEMIFFYLTNTKV